MRNPKVHLNGTVLFITASVEADLIFPVNPLSELIILKCLAAAQDLYPVRVCHFVVEATHIHLIVIVDNPDDIKDFMRHFKCESAHAINRLLGREKRTIWCERYDSPPFIDPEKIIEKIIYIYKNPAKDALADSIDTYLGVSSWSHFQRGKDTFNTFYIPRDEFRPLPHNHSLKVYQREARLLKKKKKKNTFTIYPDAWMEAFGVTDPEERKVFNTRITEGLYKAEQEYRELRAKEGKSVISPARLVQTEIATPYTPKRTGKKMICLGSEKKDRVSFIGFTKLLAQRGREVFEEWKKGSTHLKYPLGLYPPSMPKLANVVGGME